MQNNRADIIPQELQLSDLLEIAKIEENIPKTGDTILDHTVIEENYKNDILRFIATFNLQKGESPVKKNLLYKLYRTWSKEPISRGVFGVEMGTFFPTLTRSEYVYINKDAIKMSSYVHTELKKKCRHVRLKKFHFTYFKKVLDFYGVFRGNYWIEDEIFYYLFNKFAHYYGMDTKMMSPLNWRNFYTIADLLFDSVETDGGIYYKVNKEIVYHFGRYELEHLRKKYDREKEKRKNTQRRFRVPKS